MNMSSVVIWFTRKRRFVPLCVGSSRSPRIVRRWTRSGGVRTSCRRCMKDCRLFERLGNAFCQEFEEVGIDPAFRPGECVVEALEGPRLHSRPREAKRLDLRGRQLAVLGPGAEQDRDPDLGQG